MIPSHSPTAAFLPRLVRFIREGNEVALVDDEYQRYDIASTHISIGAFGYDTEGFRKEPRYWVFDAADAVIAEGDVYLMLFTGADQRVITGAVGRLTASRLFDEDLGQNRTRVTVKSMDDAGADLGEVTATIHGDDGDGTLDVNATTKIRLRADEGGSVELDVGGDCKLNGGGSGVSRIGDAVDVGSITFTAPAAIAGTYIPPIGVPVPFTLLVPVNLQGTITEGSGSVEAGD